MKKVRIAAGLLALFIGMPIWFYLLYKILESVNASELMWFLYWFYLFYKILESVNASELMWFLYWRYIPASILVGVVAKLVGDD